MTHNATTVGVGKLVLVSGASGFVGRFLCEHLRTSGYLIRRLVRHAAKQPDEVQWDPKREWVDDGALSGVDSVIHLAGESVNGRWTAAKKERIRQSRVLGTRTLAQAIVSAATPPRVFVSASAIGYYGDRGDEVLTEASAPGGDFLAEVCSAWEAESHRVDAVCKRVNPRVGIVLGPNGGALEKMALPIRLGVGGKLGSGKQWVSWISLLDLVRLLEWCLSHEGTRGVVNAVAPHPVTNAQLTDGIAQVLKRSAKLTVPAFAARLALGEFANEVLSSKRVSPQVAERAGFEWRHGSILDGLRWSLETS